MPRRIHSLDEHAFDHADNPAARYFAGLLFADGTVWRKPPSTVTGIRLHLRAPDAPILHSLRAFLRSAAPVICYRRQTNYAPQGTDSARLTVYSVRLVDALVKLNVVPNKTMLPAPTSMAGDADWWRGCVDGDGWICPLPHVRSKLLVGLTGNREVCEQFAAFVQSISPTRAGLARNHSIWRFTVHGLAGYRVIKALYGSATLSLPRKQATANRILGAWHDDGNRLLPVAL